MGAVISKLWEKRPQAKLTTLMVVLFLGLDGAGKTTRARTNIIAMYCRVICNTKYCIANLDNLQ